MLAAAAVCCSLIFAAAGFGAPQLASAAKTAANAGRRLAATAAPRGPLTPLTGEQKYAFNWAGYAQNNTTTTGPFTGAKATFVVPTVVTGTGDQYSWDWIGVGGWNEKTLVSVGIEADNLGGTAFYQAWTVIAQNSQNPLTLTIHPGDTIKVAVREVAHNKWKMTAKDLTLGTKASRTIAYQSSGGSVEAITQRPCLVPRCSTVGGLSDLAQTSNETFDMATFTTSAPSASGAVYQPLLTPLAGQNLYDSAMVNNLDTAVIATPSTADSDNDGFTVQDGSTVPPPPAS
jgi:hypothetical protein